MPILAGALEDARCDNGDILNHCRVSAVHVLRGCGLGARHAVRWKADRLLQPSRPRVG